MIAPADQDVRRRFRGYSGARPDVLRLVRGSPRNVLDVGCGAGLTGGLLRERHPGLVTIGIEADPELAQLAQQRMDKVVVGAVDAPEIQSALAALGPFDLIVCADVLEHLIDPAATLGNLRGMLAPGGMIITSIPNVRHFSTFVSLGLLGTWPMRDRGIHDRTHLRFFARRDILALGSAAGLVSLQERRNLRLVESAAWTMYAAKALDFWPLRGFLTFQYLHLWSADVST